MVPVDFVVDAARSIARNPAGAGKTVHLVDPSPLSARRVYEMIAARAGKKLPAVSVPARALQALLQLPLLERFSGVQRPAVEYLNHLAIYNCRNLIELLDGTGVRCPPSPATSTASPSSWPPPTSAAASWRRRSWPARWTTRSIHGRARARPIQARPRSARGR